MGQVYATNRRPLPVITRWEMTKWNIARLELELGFIDEWPDDVPKVPPVPPMVMRK
jgi:hypothetical protein